MKKKIALIAITALLITITVSTGIIQANAGQTKLAPGVWYSTTIHTVGTDTHWGEEDPFREISSTGEFYYQRIADKLFWATPRDIQIYERDPDSENVWVTRPGVREMASSSGSGRVTKRVYRLGRTITFNEDGITVNSPEIDQYRLDETSYGSGIYQWEGRYHSTRVGTGPLGKPTRP